MKRRRRIAFTLLCAIILSLCACSVAPREKTVILDRTKPSATAPVSLPGSISFQLEKARIIPVSSFDQAGYFWQGAKLVYGWLDNDHLAAIGVKPVSQTADATPGNVAQDIKDAPKAQYYDIKGLVGQILSVDWQTGAATELHTVQDATITSLGLSHDKSKLWYCTLGSDGIQKLSVSDSSFKHDLLEISSFSGLSPVWSSGDKLLGYFDNAKTRGYLTIFDGTKSMTYPSVYGDFRQSIMGIFDDTGEAVFSQMTGLLMSMNLKQSQALGKPVGKLQIKAKLPVSKVQKIDPANAYTLAGPDYALYRSYGAEGSRLNIYDILSDSKLGSYAGVIQFALSDDMKYICLVKETGGNTADIYVGEWQDGKIENEKLVFKGFYADGSIFFSPDDTKIYVEGRYSITDSTSTSMVLQFK
jgi:hypothetical protein